MKKKLNRKDMPEEIKVSRYADCFLLSVHYSYTREEHRYTLYLKTFDEAINIINELGKKSKNEFIKSIKNYKEIN